ncbi:MAG TPA: EVE domain-containing protein [Verrucomicrobiae bacterium]|nr:EVE domain-containing protein [Verrucomicrobiae bacterium]
MNYWLIKSEPDDFGIEDLQKKGFEPWTGVRNYQARNYMRDSMRLGDLLFFYHSNVAQPSIVGLAEVVSTPYPDPTQFKEESEYFDPKSSPDNPRWVLVDVGFKEIFPHPITLEALRTDEAFEGMLVIRRGMRLSIQPVSTSHAEEILRRVR